MGSLYRSELMSLCQLFLQTDAAFISVAQLGELGIVQFKDLNEKVSSYSKKFVNEVRRCDEMERQTKVIESDILSANIYIPDARDKIPAPLPRDMNELERSFEKLGEELAQIKNSTNNLKTNYLRLDNNRNVLRKVQILLDEGQKNQARQSILDAQGHGPILSNGHIGQEISRETGDLKFIAGVIRRDRVAAFERVLWRMCHGKVYIRTLDVEPEENAPFEDVKYAVFLIFFSGDKLREKVLKVSDGFKAMVVDNCPDSSEQRKKLLVETEVRLQDLNTVIYKTLEHRERVLHAAALNIRTWEIQVLKLKAVFHTLNKFNIDVTEKCLIAECWIPNQDIQHVRASLQYATDLSGSSVASILNIVETEETPPTYHKLNKFTKVFQGIVDSYGICNYREINPAPWTIISFPFIFAVMFGDVGHGMIMALGAIMFIIFEKKIEAAKIKDEIFNTFYGGRYVILLMGIFAIYTGSIYNDSFSRSINAFGSGWSNPLSKDKISPFLLNKVIKNEETYEIAPETSFQGEPYIWGVDPIWNVAENKLNFLNPMKMKGSVILGISQMLFGLVLSLRNYLHQKSMIDVLFVFIPQLLFLSLIFIYLCIQIVIKWISFPATAAMIFGQVYPGSHCAPSLLIGLINMFMMKQLGPGFVTNTELLPKGVDYDEYAQCSVRQWYPGQAVLESVFLVIAVICIPIMLFVKPFLLRRKVQNGEKVVAHHGGGDDHGEFNFGDVMVYQAIHTIEFALGCISHTASYLRLWALSLAHAQLSDVLWTMLLNMGLTTGGIVGIVMTAVIFFMFAVLSVSILVLMEGLSAFLHALRLHWVEFQSKFYGGNGIPFEPFSFHHLIRVHEGLEN
ncbi:unnamed protein product [Bursaphelenchus okinawaensis]|uniref:V-type proton ATPase subunit a n=1 Tax=Bursaphelenchus okinawaensis TaxID=465554 RepID=A0A811K929_9BILA|nr:unnamed protein product [Bursaphelenchus okinawaensis]CAG9094555.1 unnamed protein product [Bursaphelenchus okinawaensis]